MLSSKRTVITTFHSLSTLSARSLSAGTQLLSGDAVAPGAPFVPSAVLALLLSALVSTSLVSGLSSNRITDHLIM